MLRKWPFLIFFACCFGLLFKNKKQQTAPLEGLASISIKNVRVHNGPSQSTAVEWKLLNKNWPILIIENKNGWAKIEDAYKTSGWVKRSFLGLAMVLIKQDTLAFSEPNGKEAIAKFLKNSIARPCEILGKMCCLEYFNKKYWVNCDAIWPDIKVLRAYLSNNVS